MTKADKHAILNSAFRNTKPPSHLSVFSVIVTGHQHDPINLIYFSCSASCLSDDKHALILFL